MNINELENKLFEDWNDKFIVKDGVVDFDIFATAKAKVLILLKETNDYVNEKQDLRIFLKEGGRSATWNNLARWVYGLQNLEKDTNDIWNDVNNITSEQRQNILQSLSSINLKKKPGGATTIKKELEEETKKNLEFIKKQIQFYIDYETNFVICGGTSYLVKEHKLFGEMNFLTHKTTNIEIGQSNKTIVISYYHPQVRGQGSAKDVLFKNLINAVKDFVFNKNETFL